MGEVEDVYISRGILFIITADSARWSGKACPGIRPFARGPRTTIATHTISDKCLEMTYPAFGFKSQLRLQLQIRS
jgi:hypothetical protein